MGIESFRRSGTQRSSEPEFEWFGDQLEPTLLLRQRLSYRLEMIASLRRHLGEGVPSLAAVNSDLRADDDALNPFHVSHLVGHSIGMALDALGALELVLRDPSGSLRLPLFGVYPVARQALEASAVGLWVIGPANPAVRRTRALRVQVQEAREEASLIAEFLKDRPKDRPEQRKYKARQRQAHATRNERIDRLLHVAKESHLNVKEVTSGVQRMRAVLDEVDELHPTPEASLRAVWQYLSGLAHPSQLRAIQASDLELSETSEPGISHARMTAKEEMVLLSLDVALTLIGNLLDVSAARALNPSIRWPRADLGLPPGWRVKE
ncbi:hypothetical protein [Microbacterium sp. VKM Ac-2923]|uniref:hypothetical protein n=1 Tax=Microbacterium sp. VKM Ac-2923 TaxID=2929476 RepID=UPI001FB442D0|nr:hypothetical protein [Microbacterium sp. VKM Ac-2923]MCJ1707107.1 hypothetical protein [Microbacterium sp. VKM Ac-2923]